MPKPVDAPVADETRPRVIGLLLVPHFSMIAFTAAIEPLRLANRAAGRTLYEWRLYSVDGRAVQASNGIEIGAAGPFAAVRDVSAAIVCAGLDVQRFDHRELMAALRRLSSFGTIIGAVCTGTYVLARAGLLEGYRATIHWENHSSLAAEFPDLDISQELFEVDRNRLTCAGGTAAIDMMLSLIRREHGPEIAAQVTDQLIHHRVRDADEHQRMDLRARLDIAHPKVLAAVAAMEKSIEHPLSCAALAVKAGCSTRQLERLFHKYLGHSPTKHYVSIRLDQARDLLRQTSLPVIAIATACGFASASHFSKSYVEHFGCTPSAERKRRPASAAA